MLALTLDPPGWAHRVPAGWKMAALALTVVAVLPVTAPLLLGGFVLAVAGLYASLGWRAMTVGARMLRPLLIVVAIIFAYHAIVGQVALGLLIGLRILGLVALANWVTMTTRLDDMTAVARRVLSPLRVVGLRPEVLALAIALVIRFIPVLAQKGRALHEAWRARAARRPGARLAVPLVLLALDDTEHVSEALRARGGVDADAHDQGDARHGT